MNARENLSPQQLSCFSNNSFALSRKKGNFSAYYRKIDRFSLGDLKAETIRYITFFMMIFPHNLVITRRYIFRFRKREQSGNVIDSITCKFDNFNSKFLVFTHNLTIFFSNY